MEMDAVIDLVDWYREIYREDPGSHIAVEYMNLLYEDGDWEALLEIAENRLKCNPNCSAAKAYHGLAAWRLGRLEVARRRLLEMHKSLTFLKDAYEVLASLEKSQGNLENAEHFEKIARTMSGRASLTEAPDLPAVPQIESQEEIVEEKKPDQKHASRLFLFCDKAISKVSDKLLTLETPKDRARIFDGDCRQLIKQFLAQG
ncbi:hypothetical protein [Thermodesulforhabdus norvegica]|uniref:Tetratricopeptide repeat protein n=1 Tax=Thermodesulforhabdus norvegica TaxID=39841 RepID=A0A1I4VGD1_9BACT|nr:hypothetical protein [Thermodesulforhabdus norvegica]SFN00229.1 hypothetical protein SAMN05660836_02293 [Thermodesulforhabdus norvegica]